MSESSTLSSEPATRSPQPASGPSWLEALMPTGVTAWTRAMAVASLVANALLILTGGLVRLTGSGLGCPTWPRCTADSWTNTPEMGLHGLIEFGNRTLTFVLTVVAVLTFLSVVRQLSRRPVLFWLAFVLAIGIPVQAVIGGISVHMQLSPLVVGAHYLVSAAMISVASVLVLRTRRASLPEVAHQQRAGLVTEARGTVRALAVAVGVCTAAALYVGTLVTGTGPHAGDEDSARLAFDSVLITRAHVVPVYLLLAATLAGLILGARRRWPAVLVRSYGLLLGVLLAQGVVGYVQYFNHVPVPAVALHMVLSAVLIWAATRVCSISFAVSRDQADAPADANGPVPATAG